MKKKMVLGALAMGVAVPTMVVDAENVKAAGLGLDKNILNSFSGGNLPTT